MAATSKEKTEEIERLVATARGHVEGERTEEAVAAFRELARLEPGNVEHWLTVGYLEGKLGNLEEATAIYRKVGNHYDSCGETDMAIAVFEQVLSPFPTDMAIHLRLAELQLKMERPAKAWEHYRRALGILLAAERMRDGVLVLLAMTELAPKNAALWIRLGETAVSAGDVEEAVSAFNTAMGLLRQKKRLGEYIRVAERLWSLTPDNFALVRELGALHLKGGEVSTALERLRWCYNRNSRDVQTLKLLVRAFLRLRDRDKAINALRLLADLHLERGEAEDHALACERMLSLDPFLDPEAKEAPVTEGEGGDAAGAGGGAAEARGGAAPAPEGAAEGHHPAAAEGAPGAEQAERVKALQKEAAGYMRIGLFGGAADALSQARTLDPTNEEVFEQLKVAYLRQEMVDEVVSLLVDHAEGLADRAPDRAAALLDEAQELNADHPAVFRARMGPLDADTLDSKAHAATFEPRARARHRWSGEHSGQRLLRDIEEVTVKRPLPLDVTVKINVDDLEETLLEDRRLREQTAARRRANPFGSNDLGQMGSQPRSPAELQVAATGEIELVELSELLEKATADEEEREPARGAERNVFRPENTSPRALALSHRWRHLGPPDEAE